MLYLPDYARALRCIGQALQNQKVEVFELESRAQEFRLQYGDPNPPYTALKEISFSLEELEILDREGQARRGQSNAGIRFDSVAEMLRAVGGYINNKRAHLRRVNNGYTSMSDDPVVEIEYETRTGVQLENLTVSFLREASVNMYKRRTRLSDPVSIFARQS
ncbi:MAG: hypothetical protein E6J73_06430 [Deltaproteobacteria bacterium]|jgi:hypothetical protein|nr:MAG: hypothetical protein E6J73_06430 [Deltaproteobacteria bacterium]